VKKPTKKKALRGRGGKKAIRGRGGKRGGKKKISSKPTYQGGGVNISYNPYEAMGLVKNEKGQIVRDKNVDLDSKSYFNYAYEGDEQDRPLAVKGMKQKPKY
jgi:hypothetical protein